MTMLENQPRRYQIPTHLSTPDKIDLPLFGITVSLTMRQGVCFLLGGSVVFNLWQQSGGLAGLAGLLAHWVGPLLLTFLTYVFAVHEIQGRHLEGWILIVAHYLLHPKVFVWCAILSERTMEHAPSSSEEASVKTKDDDEENDDL
jgi:hypothetical protein